MLIKGRCLFCIKETLVAPVESWDGKGRIRYYCQDHYFDVVTFEKKQMRAFIEAYSDETARKSLSPENLELYNRLTQK